VNNRVIFLLFFLISCAPNKNYVSIQSSDHAEILELQNSFSRSFGSGKLTGKGQSNFSSSFLFDSTESFSYIVFKDILGRKLFLVEIDGKNIRYIDMRKNKEIDIEEFDRFFPLASKFDNNIYKKLLWGVPNVFEDIEVRTKNIFLISTKLINNDGSNFLNELTFSLNNEKQKYTILFNKRNFEI